MTDQQIKEQVEAIESVTKSLLESREKAAAFLKAAGIPRTPAVKPKDAVSPNKKRK